MGDSLGGRHAPAGRRSVGSQVSSLGSDGQMPVTNACEAGGWIDSADVLKVTVWLTDVKDREKINPTRQEFFGETRPEQCLKPVDLPGRT
jgi:hypothetical protein